MSMSHARPVRGNRQRQGRVSCPAGCMEQGAGKMAENDPAAQIMRKDFAFHVSHPTAFGEER